MSVRLRFREARWAIAVAAPTEKDGRTHSNIHLTGDLVPALNGELTLRKAADQTLTFQVNRRDGKPADVTRAPGQVTLGAELVPASGASVPIASGLSKDRIAAPQKVDLSKVPLGAAVLRLTLNVTTASARDSDGKQQPGTALSPQQVDIPVTVAPPPGYPTVPGTVDLGTLEGAGVLTGTLRVAGEAYPGAVRPAGAGAGRRLFPLHPLFAAVFRARLRLRAGGADSVPGKIRHASQKRSHGPPAFRTVAGAAWIVADSPARRLPHDRQDY